MNVIARREFEVAYFHAVVYYISHYMMRTSRSLYLTLSIYVFVSVGVRLKLVDKFTYLGSSVSSIEKDIKTRLGKAWTSNDRLSVIWKSDLTDEIKCSFFQAAVVLIRQYGFINLTYREKA